MAQASASACKAEVCELVPAPLRSNHGTGKESAQHSDEAVLDEVDSCGVSVGTVWRHEKVGRMVMVFRCLGEESIYDVGASLYRLAAGRWDER
jgi:hypothetical protein